MRHYLIRFATVVISLFVTIAVIELFLRTFSFDPRKTEAPLEFDQDYGWKWEAGTSGRLRDLHGEMNIAYEINSHGFYDVEHELAKPAGVRRIVFLGDSLTEGRQVLLDETFARQIQEQLNDGRALPARWESLNCGIKGYNTTQAYQLYRKIAGRFSPDIVVLGFTESDLADNHAGLSGISFAPTHVVENDRLVFQPMDMQYVGSQIHNFDAVPKGNVLNRFLRNTYVWTYKREFGVRLRTFLREGGWKGRKPGVPAGYEKFLKEYSPENKERYLMAEQVTRHLFREFNERVVSDGGRFLVLLIPSRLQIYEEIVALAQKQYPEFDRNNLDLDRFTNKLITMLEAERVPYLDLLPILKSESANHAPLYFKYDGHLTAPGHTVVSHALRADLAHRRWLN